LLKIVQTKIIVFGLYRANEVSVAAFITEGNEPSVFIKLGIFKKHSRHAVCLIVK